MAVLPYLLVYLTNWLVIRTHLICHARLQRMQPLIGRSQSDGLVLV
jgi:hypothetical protein